MNVRLLRTLRRLAACASLGAVLAAGQAETAPQDELVTRGKTIVTRDCAACHAIGATGESPLAAAPAFRRLQARYDVEALGESLAEGLTVGHGPMPEWTFAPSDIAAIVAYLKSLPPDERPKDQAGTVGVKP